MIRHPDPATLRLFVAGRLGREHEESVLSHLSDCDACLDQAEAAWSGIEELANPLDVPPMSRDSSARIEERLLGRMRIAELGSQVTWLVTEGFVIVVLALTRPLLGGPVTDPRGERR